MITDEGDDGGTNILHYTKEEVVRQAQRKGIRFEHILRSDEWDSGTPDYLLGYEAMP